MAYVLSSASFLLISIFDRVLSSCFLAVSQLRRFSIIVVFFTVSSIPRSYYCTTIRFVTTRMIHTSPDT